MIRVDTGSRPPGVVSYSIPQSYHHFQILVWSTADNDTSRYVGRTARTYQELIRKSNQAMVEDGWRKVILICILVPGGIEALYCVVHISVDLNR